MATVRLYSASDLSASELRAACLSGDLYAVGEVWASIADPDLPAVRAAALGPTVPRSGAVAERASAAWVWGARSRPPARHEFAVAGAVKPTSGPAPFVLRQIRHQQGDVVTLGDVLVTTPIRTVLDLLRFPGPLATAQEVRALLAASVDVGAVRERLEAAGGRPHARQGLRRLRELGFRAG